MDVSNGEFSLSAGPSCADVRSCSAYLDGDSFAGSHKLANGVLYNVISGARTAASSPGAQGKPVSGSFVKARNAHDEYFTSCNALGNEIDVVDICGPTSNLTQIVRAREKEYYMDRGSLLLHAANSNTASCRTRADAGLT